MNVLNNARRITIPLKGLGYHGNISLVILWMEHNTH